MNSKFSLRINLSIGSDKFDQCEKMKRDQILDILNFLVSLAIFVLPAYSVYIGLPLFFQVFPAVLLVIPLIIVLYRRRLESQTIQIRENITIADKIRVLMVKLERIVNIPNIGSSLTYNKQFLSDEVACLGWRRYFDRYGRRMSLEFAGFGNNLNYFLEEGYKYEKKEDFPRRLIDFREIVSSFCHLYEDLNKMVDLGGEVPDEEARHLSEIAMNYDNFLKALQDSSDEVEEIGNVFLGKYPLISTMKTS